MANEVCGTGLLKHINWKDFLNQMTVKIVGNIRLSNSQLPKCSRLDKSSMNKITEVQVPLTQAHNKINTQDCWQSSKHNKHKNQQINWNLCLKLFNFKHYNRLPTQYYTKHDKFITIMMTITKYNNIWTLKLIFN